MFKVISSNVDNLKNDCLSCMNSIINNSMHYTKGKIELSFQLIFFFSNKFAMTRKNFSMGDTHIISFL